MSNHDRDATLVLWHESGDDIHKLASRCEVAVLAGPLGVGKSQLTLELALAAVKAMSKGLDHGTHCAISVRAGKVVIVNYDEPKPFVIGTSLDVFDLRGRGPLYTTKNGLPGPNKDPWEFLKDQCKLIRPVLVVIDPMCWAAINSESTSDEVAHRFLIGLRNLAADFGCAVLAVAHETGRAAWHDKADSVLHMVQEGNGERVLHCETGRQVPLTGFEKWKPSLTSDPGPIA